MTLPLNITAKLTLVLGLFAALLLAGVGALASYSGRVALETATIAALLSTAIEKEAALNAWVEDRQMDIAALTNSPHLRQDVADLIAAAPASAEAQVAHDRLVRNLQPWVGPEEQYLTLRVIEATTGQVIAATDPGEEGKFKENRPFFIHGRDGPYVQNLHYAVTLQELAMTAAAPLRSSEGPVLAVLAGHLNLAEMNAIVNRRTGLHQTDEAFLVNTSNLFVTQPRFLTDPVVLRHGIQTEAVKRCLAGKSGTLLAEDYRAVPAAVVYRWLPERRLCLIVKIDQAEALAPARAFGQTMLLIGVLTLAGAVALAFVLARTITGPIRQLMAGAEAIGAGRLDTRLAVKTGDEIEQLAGAFTRMAADLETTLVSRAELFKEVAERQQAEATLRESEARYRLLAENMADVIWVLNTHSLQFTYVSPSVERLRGFTVAEVMAQPLDQVMTPASLALINASLPERLQAFLAGDPAAVTQTHDIEQTRQDGSTVWTEVVTTLLRNDADEVEVLGVSRDISERKKMEDDLRQSEENFSKAFKSSPAALLITRLADGQFLELNDAYSAIVGYERAELIGRLTTDFKIYINSVDRQVIIERLLATGSIRDFETAIRHRSGAIRHVIAAQELITFNGEACILSHLLDITERKQAEAEIRQLNAELEQRVAERTAELTDLYNNAPCGYHSLDAEGMFVRINDTELNWLGYSREELLGKMKATDLFTPASMATFRQNFPVFKTRGWLENLELDMIRKDGSILSVLLSATVITDQAGDYLMSRSTMIDYTDRKRAENALRQTQTELQAANKELEAFSYSVSHDLRAPLRAIDGFSQALLEDYTAQLDAEGQRYLQRVRAASQRMAELIDDLLTLSRITRSELHRESVNLSELAQTVFEALGQAEPERAVEGVIAPGLVVWADARLLRAALENLLGNAWKFTARQPQARIELGRMAQADQTVYFVRDNGAGFDMAYADKLFGAFQRLHSPTEFAGSGIGLATVQRIIHRHGGRIWAEGEVDQGATFYFTLSESRNDRRVHRE